MKVAMIRNKEPKESRRIKIEANKKQEKVEMNITSRTLKLVAQPKK